MRSSRALDIVAFAPSLNKEVDSPTSGEMGRSLPTMHSVRRQRGQRRCQAAIASSTCEKIKRCSSQRPRPFSKCQAARGIKVVLRTGHRDRVCGRLRHPRCRHLNLPSPALVVAPALKVKPSGDDAPSRGARSPRRRRIGRLGGRWSAVPASSPTGSMVERPCQPKAKKRLRGRVATRQTRRRRRALHALVWTIPIVASEISI